jgi:hypothetical protein
MYQTVCCKSIVVSGLFDGLNDDVAFGGKTAQAGRQISITLAAPVRKLSQQPRPVIDGARL